MTRGESLHPTRRRRDVRQRVQRGLELHVACEQHAEDTEQVLHVEHATDGNGDLARPLGRAYADRHSRWDCLDLQRGDVGAIRAVRDDFLSMRARSGDQRASERIACVDDGRAEAGPVHEPRLGCTVRGERAMVVEVIAGEIREQRDVECDAIDAALVETVRRHLHRDGSGAIAHPLREQRVQHAGIGRRVG
jgi:hypothetical protein